MLTFQPPEYYFEHIWDWMAAEPRLSDKTLRHVRRQIGLPSDDSSYDHVIRHEFCFSAARRENPQRWRMIEIIRGPQHS